jgi:hypothetical protein
MSTLSPNLSVDKQCVVRNPFKTEKRSRNSLASPTSASPHQKKYPAKLKPSFVTPPGNRHSQLFQRLDKQVLELSDDILRITLSCKVSSPSECTAKENTECEKTVAEKRLVRSGKVYFQDISNASPAPRVNLKLRRQGTPYVKK